MLLNMQNRRIEGLNDTITALSDASKCEIIVVVVMVVFPLPLLLPSCR